MRARSLVCLSFLISAGLSLARAARGPRVEERLEGLKKEALDKVESRAKLTQVMVDSIFSFGELVRKK